LITIVGIFERLGSKTFLYQLSGWVFIYGFILVPCKLHKDPTAVMFL